MVIVVRMTKQRKLILDLFKKRKTLLSAEMIYEQLGKDVMDLSTIYRTLDLFSQENILAKSFIQNMSYYYLNDGMHHHYLICLNCHKMIPIECHLFDLEQNVNKTHEFKVTHHDMTLYGYCKECQEVLI